MQDLIREVAESALDPSSFNPDLITGLKDEVKLAVVHTALARVEAAASFLKELTEVYADAIIDRATPVEEEEED